MSKKPKNDPKAQTELTNEELEQVQGAGDAGSVRAEKLRDDTPLYQIQAGVPTKVSQENRTAADKVRHNRG